MAEAVRNHAGFVAKSTHGEISAYRVGCRSGAIHFTMQREDQPDSVHDEYNNTDHDTDHDTDRDTTTRTQRQDPRLHLFVHKVVLPDYVESGLMSLSICHPCFHFLGPAFVKDRELQIQLLGQEMHILSIFRTVACEF